MDKSEVKDIFDEHLRILAKRAKQQCSGEELKVITEAMLLVISHYSSIDDNALKIVL